MLPAIAPPPAYFPPVFTQAVFARPAAAAMVMPRQKPYLTFQDLNTVRPADVLVVLAHPDDELFLSGTIAELRQSGKTVQLVYATNGKAGQDVSGRGLTGDALGVERSLETVQAGMPLGVDHPPIVLDFMDGATGAAPEALKEQLRAVLLQTRPGMVLMYNAKDGVTGHPDHINVARFLEEELDTLASGQTLRDLQDRQKLGYLLKNNAVYQVALSQTASKSFHQQFPVDDPTWKVARFQPDEAINVRVFLPKDVQALKNRSMQTHRTQYGLRDTQGIAGFYGGYPYEELIRYQIHSRKPANNIQLGL